MTGRIVFALEFGPDAQFNANIFTIEPDGSDIRQITHYEAAKAVGPAWSPDGDRIFFSLLDPAESESSHVWSMDAAGGDLVQLTSEEDAADGEPDMSPDGKQIAFRRCVGCANAAPGEDLGAIVLLSTSDLSVVQVTHPTKADGDGDSAPMFSPDGRTLAFTRMGAVWTVGVDGTNLRRMTEPVLDASRPRWSADGERLFFTGAAGLMALTLASGDVEELSGAEFGTPSWSPNGEWMVFHRWPGDPYIGLYIAEPDGSNPIEIWRTPRQTDYFIYWTDWGTAP